MKRLITKAIQLLATMTIIMAVVVPTQGFAKGVNEEPSAGAMVADAVVARPLFLVTSVLGAGLYVATLPLSLLGGNAEQAGKTLVVEPVKNTFVRCLGCRHAGYQK